jgi:glycosyltransferase involved in cell wall biosynthesis
MRVAILGTRGIPAAYSGFETAAEQLASRLSERGHEVVVYCRPHVVDRKLDQWRGARLVHLPTVRNKYLDTFAHTLLSALHSAYRLRPDVALFFIAGNSPLCLITRRAGIPTVINVDGLDSDRDKWPPPAKAYLRFAERNAPRWADHALTDSHAVAETFERRYRRRIGVVPYGVDDPGHDGREMLDSLGLEPRRYVLFVGRLEPENNPHVLVDAFARIPAERARGMKLVIVGGAPYADDYIRQVRRKGDPRVLFPGYVFGRGYWELQRHAYLFCAPTEVGGTHPVILEALAAGNCVVVNDHAPNVETVGDAGLTFSGGAGVPALTTALQRCFDDPDLVAAYRHRALERARRYSWDAVTDQYERLLRDAIELRGHGPLPAHLVDSVADAAVGVGVGVGGDPAGPGSSAAPERQPDADVAPSVGRIRPVLTS